MDKLIRYTILILLGLSAGFGAGCGRKAAPPEGAYQVTDSAETLAAEREVMAAIEKKDYDGAVAALLKVRQAATTDKQIAQFTVLSRKVKNKLLEAAPTDPKAAEAVTALRAMTLGR